nr:MAG TPA: hypothetical protein [Caudoviricetes sp.]
MLTFFRLSFLYNFFKYINNSPFRGPIISFNVLLYQSLQEKL